LKGSEKSNLKDLSPFGKEKKTQIYMNTYLLFISPLNTKLNNHSPISWSSDYTTLIIDFIEMKIHVNLIKIESFGINLINEISVKR
jgi:hypothetical protein